VDPGAYTYTPDPYRQFFKGRSAHNVVTVDGLPWSGAATTRLVAWNEGDGYVDIRLRTTGYAGVVHTRRIVWLRGYDVILVDDQLESRASHTYRQLWHFVDGSHPTIGAATVQTERERGNVLVRQLLGSPELRLIGGQTAPVQGWISYHYGRKVPAPVAEAILRGSSVRYLTLIAVAPGRPNADVSGVRLRPDGFGLTVTVDGRSERVAANGTDVWVTPLTEE
jgi:hypothetical protein